MSNKKAFVIPIDDHVKVVFGTTVKTIKLSEAKKPENVQFMDRLFADFDVLTVEQISALTKDEFFSSLDALLSDTKTQTEVVQSAPKPQTQSAPSQSKPQKKPSDGGLWFKSMTETLVILDDVDGEKSIRNGVEFKQGVIIYPNRAINLGRYDKAQLKKSQALRKLINDGDLMPCSSEDASMLEKRYFDGQNAVPRGFNELGSGSYLEDSESENKRQNRADILELGSSKRDDIMPLGDVDPFGRDVGPEDMENASLDDLLRGT